MATLVVAEHNSTTLFEATARTVAAAAQLSGAIDVLVLGKAAPAVADAAARLTGVRAVLMADAPALADSLDEPVADAVLQVAEPYSAILFSATSSGKSVAPRVAALLDVMQVSDIVAVVGPKTFKRPIYAGNALQTVESTDPKVVVTVRPSAFSPVGSDGNAELRRVSVDPGQGRARLLGTSIVASDRPELTEANIVIAGGRALGSAEKFQTLIVPLADALGAAIGASRAAVDAGYAPNDWQVGQTGKVVAPDLYIAIGISGAIQHVAGMKASKVIVAINSDGNAPIFQYADYGLVGDLFAIVPELTSALSSRS